MRSVNRITVGSELNLFRFYPRYKSIIFDFFYFSFVKVTRKTVFQEYRRFLSAEQFRVQSALVYLACNVYRRIFKVEFVSAVNDDIIVRKILFADIIHLVDTVNPLTQNSRFYLSDFFPVYAFFHFRKPAEQVLRKVVQVYGTVDFYNVGALRSVEHFKGVCKIIDVYILLNDVLYPEILLTDFNYSAEVPAAVFDKPVFLDVFQIQERVHAFFLFVCVFGINLFRKQKFYVFQNTRIENTVLRRHKHHDGKKSHNYGKCERTRSDCNENNCKHDQRNDYVCHRIAFPYRVFYFDFLRNYSHSVLSPPLLSDPSVVSAEVLSSEYLSELSPPPLLSALFFL